MKTKGRLQHLRVLRAHARQIACARVARVLATTAAAAVLVGCGSGKFTISDAGPETNDASASVDGGTDVADDPEEAAAQSEASRPAEAAAEAAPAVTNSGDCIAGECGRDRCLELTEGGYRTCIGTVVEATSCSIPAGACCRSDGCVTDGSRPGKCVAGPTTPACGATGLATNVCAYDQCRTHEECAALGSKAICVPATGFGRKAAYCLPAGCRVDADCKEEAGGACLTVSDPCCTSERVAGLYCVYRNRCRKQSDCATGEYCKIDGARTRCVAGVPTCGIGAP